MYKFFYKFLCVCFCGLIHLTDWILWIPYLVTWALMFFLITFPPTSQRVLRFVERNRENNVRNPEEVKALKSLFHLSFAEIFHLSFA